MKLTFLGTRGNIEETSPRHGRHTALMIRCARRRIMIDCGEDWRGDLDRLRPHAIVLTHAHPDHAWGLKDGAVCPVFAAPQTIEFLKGLPINELHPIELRRRFEIDGVTFEAFPVEHSIRCPAVAYRVAAKKSPRSSRPACPATAASETFFYAPDVAYIPHRDDALAGIGLYIGDGATGIRTMVRKRGEALIGHAAMRTQITWCKKTGVSRAVFTHCGKHIVTGDESAVLASLHEFAAKPPPVEIAIAHDGMEVTLPGSIMKGP